MNWSFCLLCLVAVVLSVEAAEKDGTRPKREPQVANGGLVGALLESALARQHYGHGGYGHRPSYNGHGSHGHHEHGHQHEHGHHEHGHGFGFGGLGGQHEGHHGGHGHHEHGHHHGHH